MTHLAGQHLKKNRQYVLLFNILFNCDDGEIWERTQLVSDDFTMTPMGGAIVYRCISFSPILPFTKRRKKERKLFFLVAHGHVVSHQRDQPSGPAVFVEPPSQSFGNGRFFVCICLFNYLCTVIREQLPRHYYPHPGFASTQF